MHRCQTSRSSYMLRSAGVLATVALGITLLAGPAFAFDNSRRGFVLEFGLGPAMSSQAEAEYDFSSGQSIPVPESGLGFAGTTRFRIGHGVSDRCMITYVNDVAWASEDLSNGDSSNFTASGMNGVGITVFTKPDSPSWAFESAIGWGTITNIDDSESIDSGLGLQVGAGYEIARHWLPRFTVMRGWHDGIDDRWVFSLTMSAVLY